MVLLLVSVAVAGDAVAEIEVVVGNLDILVYSSLDCLGSKVDTVDCQHSDKVTVVDAGMGTGYILRYRRYFSSVLTTLPYFLGSIDVYQSILLVSVKF